MKVFRNAFTSDVVALTRWELVKLFFGFKVEADAMTVMLDD